MTKYKKSTRHKTIISLLLTIWILSIVGLFFFKFFPIEIGAPTPSQKQYPELQKLKNNTYDFTQLKTYFTNLAQKKGGVYAYKILQHADIPANTDLHLLGHAVGEQLYKQQGIEGMEYCTQDFRNACSHSIVVGTLLDNGATEKIFEKIDQACKKAPGGYGAYGLCYHGLGHGVLAYTNYDMRKAAKLCEKTMRLGENIAYAQCISGTVMEIVGGGDHDKKTWTKQSTYYLSDPNPLALCQSTSIKAPATSLCYNYITPHLFTLAGFDPSNTHDPVSFQKAFLYCDAIPELETRSRDACFGGFGKEFVVLAKDRDIRNIGDMTKRQLTLISQWCHLAPTEKAQQSCIFSALTSLFWGGENKPHAAVGLCTLLFDKKEQKECFTFLFSVVTKYIKDPTYQQKVCKLVPQIYKNHCQEK